MAILRNVIDKETCAALIDIIERLRAKPSPHFRTLSPPTEPITQSDLFRWQEDETLAKLVTEGVLPQLAAHILDTNKVILLEDQFFYSEPGCQFTSPWHQDHSYHPLEPWFLTFWIPLDPVDSDHGLRAVVGSHRGPLYAPVEFSAAEATLAGDGTSLKAVPDIDELEAVGSNILAPSFEAGDVMILHSKTLHAGGKACPSVFRRLSIRYAHPEIHYVQRAWPIASFWQEP
ncbi:phytanoyl-CoA dioxygenase family protein [Synechococcus sp. R55.6]|uniref:phytanoyl-CoA dioxygenase family protein n=1 Tax=Synechococcus sp. R55.4 TaxID=2964497 RepID=UPI0039C3991F